MHSATQTKLESLLKDIDPTRTLDEMDRRANAALGRYPLTEARYEDWREYVGCLTHFYAHLEGHLLNLKGPYPGSPAMWWGQCSNVLERIYGREGYKTAFQLVRSGTEGGLYGVLKAIARNQARHYADTEIRARISAFWISLSAKERFDAINEYIDKFRGLLPVETRAGSSSGLKVRFWEVLEEHPRMLQRLRRAGR